MSWNYRILDHGNHFALHEVFYDGDAVRCWTQQPVGFVVDAHEGGVGIAVALEIAQRDACRRPVLVVATELAVIAARPISLDPLLVSA